MKFPALRVRFHLITLKPGSAANHPKGMGAPLHFAKGRRLATQMDMLRVCRVEET